jgi:hypothetical protein
VSFARAVPIALLLALAAPAAARADATLSVSGTAPNKTLTFTVGDALRHVMLASVDGGNLVITDPQGIAVGASGCTIIDAKTADCGSVASFELGVFVFGDGDDELGLDVSFPIPVRADGGAGDDILLGGWATTA